MTVPEYDKLNDLQEIECAKLYKIIAASKVGLTIDDLCSKVVPMEAYMFRDELVRKNLIKRTEAGRYKAVKYKKINFN